jgi:dihydrofolate reductase
LEAIKGSAAEVITNLAAIRDIHTQKALLDRIEERTGVVIGRQSWRWWTSGEYSFPNDIAEVLTEALDLNREEQVNLALSLSFRQKSRRLRDKESA